MRIRKGVAQGAWRWNLSALGVVALALGLPGTGRAQASTGGAKSVARVSPPAPKRSAENGMNTGIKVHGHWTINIPTKEGKLVSHHEFENSLANGGPILSNLLGGNTTPSGLAILLGGSVCPGGANLQTLNGFPAICPIVVANSAMANSSSVPSFSPNSACDASVDYICQQQLVGGDSPPIDYLNLEDDYSCQSGGPCSATLNVSLPGGNGYAGGPSLTLSGAYTAPSNALPGASISDVAVTGYVCSNSFTPSACVKTPGSGGTIPVLTYNVSCPAAGVTCSVLPGTTALFANTSAITSTTFTAISVAPGQIIQATVVISFS